MNRPTNPGSRLTLGHAALLLTLGGAVVAALLLPWEPTVAQARRYGKRYNYNYGAAIARCKSGCRSTVGAISACRNRFLGSQRTQCVQASKAAQASCAGDSSCKKSVQHTLRTCVGDAARQVRADRGQTNARGCGRCCQRSRGSGDCLGYMAGSRFYGSSRYHGQLSCPDYTGAPRAVAPLSDATDRLREHALTWLHDLIARIRA